MFKTSFRQICASTFSSFGSAGGNFACYLRMEVCFGFLALPLIVAGVLPTIVLAQEFPCSVGPKAIRAYAVAKPEAICLILPANEFRKELRVARRSYTNGLSAWQAWSEIDAITSAAVAKEAIEYCDTNIVTGVHYEYQIASLITNYTCDFTTTVPYRYYQYISTGIKVPLVERRGKVVLLVERNIAGLLPAELSTLESDLIGDGYEVFRHDVAASEVTDPIWKSSVANTKAIIRAEYNLDPNAAWTILIVGHVPIPYSGLSSPGSHTENFGAHPADWYYADMDESAWTDLTANDTSASHSFNWNVPGDGKFDQSYMPSAPELRIGRVDLVNMPAFGKSETELLRQYLNREHAWRHKQFFARDRGLVNAAGLPYDSLNYYSSFFGDSTSADAAPWLSVATNRDNSYLFAASKGSGRYDRDNQLGATTNFAAAPLYAVFTTMYGSYYGDWDSAMIPNVVLLAPIASEGYPVSVYYHENIMSVDSSAMGEAIGYELYAMGANRFLNSRVRYNQFARLVGGATYVINEYQKNYVTLMGDPTLRIRTVAPPGNVTVKIGDTDNVIAWTPAVDADIEGYHVYRAPAANLNDFTRVSGELVSGNSFRDTFVQAGAPYRYMVRTVKLEQSASRSFYNSSQGMFAAEMPGLKLSATLGADNSRVLQIVGEAGHQYTIESTMALSNTTLWQPFTNVTLSATTGAVSLPDANQVIFYRLRR